jgi:hypothetical protein
MHLGRILEHANNDNDPTTHNLPSHILPREGGSYYPDPENKPTPQHGKTVGYRPTVAADRKKLKGHPALNDIAYPINQVRRIYNKSTTDNNDTTTLTAQNRLPHADSLKLPISTPDPPTGSGTSRRRVQRFKR